MVVIGAGISGLAAAAALAQQGARVTVLEKNQAAGGRARTWETQGFRFDMGPSFYWMPDVFERGSLAGSASRSRTSSTSGGWTPPTR